MENAPYRIHRGRRPDGESGLFSFLRAERENPESLVHDVSSRPTQAGELSALLPVIGDSSVWLLMYRSIGVGTKPAAAGRCSSWVALGLVRKRMFRQA